MLDEDRGILRFCKSNSIKPPDLPAFGDRTNYGAYELPFSGVGEEYYPLGLVPGESGVVLHEAGFLRDNYNWNFPKVYSPFWRLYYNYQPGHLVRFGERAVPLEPGHAFLISNHQLFDCIGDAPVNTLWFAFTYAGRVDPGQEMPVVLELDPVINAYIEAFPDLFDCHDDSRRMRLFQMSLSFVLYCLSRREICIQPPIPDIFQRVLDAISDHPSRKWNNCDLAEIAGLSTGNFIRTFHKLTGSTPAQHVIEVRLREAARHLSNTDSSVDAIAARCGFTDRFHFSRVFKKHTGITPAQYRKLNRT